MLEYFVLNWSKLITGDYSEYIESNFDVVLCYYYINKISSWQLRASNFMLASFCDLYSVARWVRSISPLNKVRVSPFSEFFGLFSFEFPRFLTNLPNNFFHYLDFPISSPYSQFSHQQLNSPKSWETSPCLATLDVCAKRGNFIFTWDWGLNLR